jgi:hypothetical protein
VKKFPLLVTILIVCAFSATRAVILLDTGDPSANTAAPTGALANSGWQFQGTWGEFVGTPIAPHFFIAANHIGQVAPTFSFQGSTYTIVRSFNHGGDLIIWQVRETFPTFAPLYSHSDEAGSHLVVIGRGVQRGVELFLNSTLRGWRWGGYDGVQRWGENDVADVVPYQGHDLLYATFDQSILPNDHPNESHLADHDSSGAVFINDANDGAWKLAGINYAVDDLYTAPDLQTAFVAAVFDARGYYSYDGANFTQIADATAVPTGFYSSRISSELAWVGSAIADPQVGREDNFLVFTYSKLIVPVSELTYVVEQSTDLATWTPATTQDEVLSTNGDIQMIKANIDIGTSTQLFVRLRVARP